MIEIGCDRISGLLRSRPTTAAGRPHPCTSSREATATGTGSVSPAGRRLVPQTLNPEPEHRRGSSPSGGAFGLRQTQARTDRLQNRRCDQRCWGRHCGDDAIHARRLEANRERCARADRHAPEVARIRGKYFTWYVATGRAIPRHVPRVVEARCAIRPNVARKVARPAGLEPATPGLEGR